MLIQTILRLLRHTRYNPIIAWYYIFTIQFSMKFYLFVVKCFYSNDKGVVYVSGFCGFLGTNGGDKAAIIKEMLGKIAHRGPDFSGTYIEDTEDGIAIGFNRLLVIGRQEEPIFNEDRSKILVFNGSIFNYQALKKSLTDLGHVFSTELDGECLLHLYEEYGDTQMLTHLRGAFTFAIYDTETKTLFAARDYFGVKPFYYCGINSKNKTFQNKTFLFGSEIKSFVAHPDFVSELNEEALSQYLTFQYSVLPETFFKGVYKLPPGHYLIYKNGEYKLEKYFSPKFKPANMSLEMAVNALDKTIGDSLQAHMVSDVEVGSFLSSGVDSSLVAVRFTGERAFTVGFDYENYNEIDYSRELVKETGLTHHTKTITTEEFWDALPKVQYHMDEPLADPAAVALYFASKEAANHVKVALSGEGADEFFGGYNIYKEPLDLKIITSLPMPIRRFLGKLASLIPFNIKGKNFLIRASKTIEERFIGGAYIFTKEERALLLKSDTAAHPQDVTAPVFKEAGDVDDITKMQHLDIRLWMVGDILLKADKMSMAHSLEVRSPFLDKEVFKVASRVPTNLRVNRGGTKYAFRRAAARHLPESFARRKKLGFPVPVRLWLREDKYYDIVRSHFTSPTAEKYFNTGYLLKVLDEHKSKKRDNSRKIWTVFMFLLWHGQFYGE